VIQVCKKTVPGQFVDTMAIIRVYTSVQDKLSQLSSSGSTDVQDAATDILSTFATEDVFANLVQKKAWNTGAIFGPADV